MLDVHLWKWKNSEFEIDVTPSMFNFSIFSSSTTTKSVYFCKIFSTAYFIKWKNSEFEIDVTPSMFNFSIFSSSTTTKSVYFCIIFSTAYFIIKIDPLITILDIFCTPYWTGQYKAAESPDNISSLLLDILQLPLF